MSVYAIADLHGRYDLWTEVKEFLQPNDFLYCLGDNIDRGPAGMHIFWDMLRRPNTQVLMGNHEEMCLQDFSERIPLGSLWFLNGGETTYKEMDTWEAKEPGTANMLLTFMRRLPYMITYHSKGTGKDIALHHAGFDPDWAGTNIRYRLHDQEKDVWNRKHLPFEWPKREDCQNLVIVHGHTPVETLSYFHAWGLEQSYWQNMADFQQKKDHPRTANYCDGHKIDIDLSAVSTDWTVLLDLDTFEEHYFNCPTLDKT